MYHTNKGGLLKKSGWEEAGNPKISHGGSLDISEKIEWDRSGAPTVS